MNIADSMIFVLKSKTQTLFTDFWNDDVKTVLKETGKDLSKMIRNGAGQIRTFKRSDIKTNFNELYDSTIDMVTIFKVIPKRVKEGFSFFRDDLTAELDQKGDSKHKTIFCLKVIASLSSFTLGAIYNVKRGQTEFSFKGLKRKNAFTQFLVYELIFKLSQVFILRFLGEVEKQVSHPEELANIRFFKGLISDRSKLQEEAENLSKDAEPGDKALEIVENLKNYIFTGKRD
ncbi:MAG TPA: hypothetical protein VNJ01_13270 [Bacteriovoracaceae bacterium]|nr:hypothetical protein [Bacteriovoracaceae bacterium]